MRFSARYVFRSIIGMVLALVFAAVQPIGPGGERQARAGTAPVPLVTGARLAADGEATRFTADLSFPVSFNVYVLADPYRVIVDMPEASFNLAPGAGEEAGGLVAGFRFGTVGAGKGRIVIDTTGPVLIDNSFVLPAKGDDPARMVIDLVATDEATFARTIERDGTKSDEALLVAKSAEAAKAGDNAAAEAGGIPIPRPKPATEGGAATEGRAAAAGLPARKTQPIVVIDPGHGGIDPGAIGKSGQREKDVVLKFSRTLKERLTATGRYRVFMTRDDDRFLRLKERVSIARDNSADLFIAIHADSLRSAEARGATVYTLSDKASDAEAEALAEQENRADIIAGVDLGDENDDVTGILIDLVQRETRNHSVFFAKRVVSSIKPVTAMTGRPLRSAGFRVLKAPDVPSVLVELGYLSSASDEKLLMSAEWQAKVAGAIADAVNGYFATQIAAGE